MLVFVRHGQDEEVPFNASCRASVFLHFVRQHCGYTNEAQVDLAEENGVVKRVSESPDVDASTVLTERGRYILVAVDTKPGEDGDTMRTFRPLLQPNSESGEVFVTSTTPTKRGASGRTPRADGANGNAKTPRMSVAAKPRRG